MKKMPLYSNNEFSLRTLWLLVLGANGYNASLIEHFFMNNNDISFNLSRISGFSSLSCLNGKSFDF